MAVATGAWLFPMDSGLLEFSDAEMQFLFPAPVSRRQLLIHRMLRSQLGMLFGSIVIGLASPSPLGVSRLRISVGAWILLVTGKIYFTGVTLARARLGAGSARIRRLAWLPLTVMLAALAVVGIAIARDVRQSMPAGVGDVIAMLGRVAGAGAPRAIVWPFTALVRPLFSAWPQPYLTNVALAIAVMAGITLWVLLSDEAFQEAMSDAVARRGQQPAGKKASRPTPRVDRPGSWRRPAGPRRPSRGRRRCRHCAWSTAARSYR